MLVVHKGLIVPHSCLLKKTRSMYVVLWLLGTSAYLLLQPFKKNWVKK